MHSTDLVLCSCGEIFVDGGDAMKCGANDWSNFLRLDEQGNEVIVKITEKEVMVKIPEESAQTQLREALEALETLVEHYQELPAQALYAPVTHADLGVVLSLLSLIMRTRNSES